MGAGVVSGWVVSGGGACVDGWNGGAWMPIYADSSDREIFREIG